MSDKEWEAHLHEVIETPLGPTERIDFLDIKDLDMGAKTGPNCGNGPSDIGEGGEIQNGTDFGGPGSFK